MWIESPSSTSCHCGSPNSAQATGAQAKPSLGISIHLLQGSAEIDVTDEGQGMDRRRLAQLFEPLRTSKAMGTGLGLAIAHRLVRARGGDLLISSEPARGTRVRIRLLLEPVAAGAGERGGAAA